MPFPSTERLFFRPIECSDAEFIHQLYNGEVFKRFVGDKQLHSLDDTRAYIESTLHSTGVYGMYLLLLRETQTPIGVCGLLQRDSLPEVDIGYGILPEHRGQGYALEACRAVLTFAADCLRLPRLLAITHIDNVPSQKILQKLGFEVQTENPPEDQSLCLYRCELNGQALAEGRQQRVQKSQVERFYRELWDAHDLGVIAGILHPDCLFRGSLGQHKVGHTGFSEYVDSVHKALGNYLCHIEACVAEGNQVFAKMRFTGQHRDQFLGFAPTGQDVSWQGSALFTFADTRIEDIWVLGDLKSLETQLNEQRV